MTLRFPPLTRKWNLEDSDSDTSKPNTPTARPSLGTRSRSRHKHKATDRKPVHGSSELLERAAARGVNERADSVDPVLSPPVLQPEPPSPDWRRWEIFCTIGVLAVAFLVIFGFPRIGESSWPSSSPQSALLPSRNILQSRNITAAKLDISALDLVCQGSHLPICDVPHLFHSLDLKVSENHQDIKSLGSHLGTLLHPTKMATNKEECSYFPQLQLDINQAWNRTFGIQDSLNATLVLNGEILSCVSKSRLDAEQSLASADKGADGHIVDWGKSAERERAHTDSVRWLNILDDYSQKLASRDEDLRWELERQNRLQSDLKGVEKQIEGLGIEQVAGNQILINSFCTAFNMQRVERRLINTMMTAAEDEAAAQNLGNYYDAL